MPAVSEFSEVAALVSRTPVVYSCGSRRISGVVVIRLWQEMSDRDDISEAEALNRIWECECTDARHS